MNPQPVILTSADPERAATAALHLIQIAVAPMLLIVVGYGEHAAEVYEIVAMLRGGELVNFAQVEQFIVIAEAGLTQSANRNQAIQNGLRLWRFLETDAPLAAHIAVLDDYARPYAGWFSAMAAEFFPSRVTDAGGKMYLPLGLRVGIVGPVCDQAVTVAQRCDFGPDNVELIHGIDAYAAQRAEHFAGTVSVADTLDPMCFMLSTFVIPALLDEWREWGDPDFGVWSCAVLCIAVEKFTTGRAVVAEGVYVRPTETASHRPVVPVAGDTSPRLQFINGANPYRCIATIRVGLATLRDLHLLRGTVTRAGMVCDGVAVLLRNNPMQLMKDPEVKAAMDAPAGSPVWAALTEADRLLLARCDGAQIERVARSMGDWLAAHTVHTAKGRRVAPKVGCDVWSAEGDEQRERTALDDLAGRLARLDGTKPTVWCLALNQDELIEDGVTREFIERLCEPLNPIVSAYDLPLLTMWDAPRLIRDDAPWGDGGSWRGGPSDVRLYRQGRPFLRAADGSSSLAPLFSADATRVAAIRLKRTGLLRPQDRARMLKGPVNEDGMRVMPFDPANRLGVHMLVYERENPDDVARWLDEVEGLADVIVLVWTGEWTDADKLAAQAGKGSVWPDTGPSRSLHDVARSAGARWVHHPLADNLAAARNAGITALEQAGMTWAMFIDPDEWLADVLADGKAIRRACESSRQGWLMQVANYGDDGEISSVSDSIRISRIGAMQMTGRVHESFGDSLNAMVDAGIHPRVVYLPFVLQHRGMGLGEARTREKLDAYERLLRLELADNPRNTGAWVSLAWHMDNDGHPSLAEECLRRAVACAGRSYLPFREEGVRHLRIAREMFEACVERLSTGHQYSKQGAATLAWLRENAPPSAKRTPSARRGMPEPLPDFRVHPSPPLQLLGDSEQFEGGEQ